MLSIKDVESGHGLVPAIQGVSLEVAPGEIVAVLGPNGAGKSTLLRTVSGRLATRSGSISVSGAQLNGMSSHQIASW